MARFITASSNMSMSSSSGGLNASDAFSNATTAPAQPQNENNVNVILTTSLYDLVSTESPAFAVLFPWMVEILGVIILYLLTRYEINLPHASVLFALGAGMGVGAVRCGDTDQLTISILQWSLINSEVLLLVFLPGLLFRDAIEVNFDLFIAALGQIVILAFPMVLLGTALTALVANYILPYAWSWSLCMTLGAIMASTDPIAVANVMGKAGAPPRLQIHLSGESLLNDGSSMVFFSIFSQMFLSELGVGDSVSVGEGFIMFLRMAIGGLVIGFAFGCGLVALLYELDRRMEPEYNILQIVSALSAAYLSYYVADQVLNMSGVTACVTCGIVARGMGRGMIRDEHMMDSYLALMEFLLNTLLFSLAGSVWGAIVGNPEHAQQIKLSDWGYLMLFYLLISAIRFVQVGVFYPILNNVGLKTNWREATFISFAGFRGTLTLPRCEIHYFSFFMGGTLTNLAFVTALVTGAVGLALSVSLTTSVFAATSSVEDHILVGTMQFISGGVALLTLVLNGVTAPHVLKLLKLAKPVPSRKRALKVFEVQAEEHLLHEYKWLVSQPRFREVSFKVIKEHVPLIRKEITSMDDFNGVNYRTLSEFDNNFAKGADDGTSGTLFDRFASVSHRMDSHSDLVAEIRALFQDLLDEIYADDRDAGELVGQEHSIVNIDVLRQSMALFASSNAVVEPLNNWEFTHIYSVWDHCKSYIAKKLQRHSELSTSRHKSNLAAEQQEHLQVRVIKALTFIGTHRLAQHRLRAYAESLSSDETSLGPVEQAVETVLEESNAQIIKARELLQALPLKQARYIKSHYVSYILLNKLEKFVRKSVNDRTISQVEAQNYLDKINKSKKDVMRCRRNELDTISEEISPATEEEHPCSSGRTVEEDDLPHKENDDKTD